MDHIKKSQGKIDLDEFRSELIILCRRYKVMVEEEKIKRTNLDGPIAFYKISLSMKVESIDDSWLRS